ncbi:29901_t:CDS:2, partial [Gigaspora margarita]
MSINNSSSSNPLESTSAKRKADKAKGGRPRMPIWNNYIEGEDDGHGHFEATMRKTSTMEALALHCKGPVPDDIRKRWLIEVAKRDALSGSLLDGEIARVIDKMEAELQKTDNLTLSLDGWTSPRGDLLYAFIITTPNYIIENIGPHQFAAIVTDNGFNLVDFYVIQSHQGGSLETYSKTHWVSIYDTTNSIIHVKSAIDK